MTGLQNSENPSRSGFNWRQFARDVRAYHEIDGRGLRTIAPAIGVTTNDLSRARLGQHIVANRIIDICNWMGRDIREYHIPADHLRGVKRFTFDKVEQPENKQKHRFDTGAIP